MVRKADFLSLVLRFIVWASAAVTLGAFLLLTGHILVKGIPSLSPKLFALKYTTENHSMLPSIINTLLMTMLSLIMAAPPGIFAAIYLTEYAHRGNKLVALVGITSETLSGIPSIVYGLFGYLFFLVKLRWGYSLLSGACTMAIMILPLILRTTQEALNAVPDSYREGSFGLGSGRLRTVFGIVLPAAVPGILSGVILSVGRIVSETAALLYTAGTTPKVPKSIMDSARTLSIHMYALSTEGLYVNEAYATAAVLLFVVVMINLCSNFLARQTDRSKGKR